ncbi:Hypothetical protein R9X50_00177400 [Acrodontium crateriforme]|uniref:t-SNARE coiled-coil homology domain-containing protein n=1 Tax=Acrodontium crateriforme TaxID=150365 RepID=A0AAQ3M2L9_9PEZI|nr:Hypothetical protein R9X50_00177400 [Acrodontium crateriforme]
MSSTTPHQLFLLADHLKLSLLERQRAIVLNLEPNKQDPQITRSLDELQDGIEQLESDANDDTTIADTERLRKQYEELYTQFHGKSAPSAEIRTPNNKSLKGDFDAAQSRGDRSSRKNVRFRDDPGAPEQEDAVEAANRAALFDGDRYRDEPALPDHSELDNQQIHAYHSQVLQEQDEQLDVLGQSIGRQRILGIQMGDELDEQAEMLDDMERGVDRHTTTLDRARRRLGDVARKSKGNWSWITIGILICILVLLLIILK